MMAAATGGACIGPNAVIQVAAALANQLGAGVASELMLAAGLASYVKAPPQHMIDEAEVVYWGVCPACQRATGNAAQQRNKQTIESR